MKTGVLMYLARTAANLAFPNDPPVIYKIDDETVSVSIECSECDRRHIRLFYLPDGGEEFEKVCRATQKSHEFCPCGWNRDQRDDIY